MIQNQSNRPPREAECRRVSASPKAGTKSKAGFPFKNKISLRSIKSSQAWREYKVEIPSSNPDNAGALSSCRQIAAQSLVADVVDTHLHS